jgi:tetratricopeptide (TPR) repeat protein
MAEAFGKLGTALSLSGRDAEADEPSGRAVDQYRGLHVRFPGQYVRDLAISLNNRVGLLDRLGDVAGAEQTSAEAVSLFRSLREDAAEIEGARNLESWVQDVRPDLETALIARATILSKLKRLEDEVGTVEEAVSILRPMADEAPDQFLYLLGQALNNFAAALERQARQSEAVAALTEAVGIFEQLTQLQPAFRQLLAHVLGEYMVALARNDRLEESAEAGWRAVAEYKALVGVHPEVHRTGLDRTQSNLAIVLEEIRSRADGSAAR